MDSLKEVKTKFLKSNKSVVWLAEKTGLTEHHLRYLLSDYCKGIDVDDYCKIMSVLNQYSPYNCETVTGSTLQLISNITESINILSGQVKMATADNTITEQEKLILTVTLDHMYDTITQSIANFKKTLKGAK
ncbi:MAG: hypothetical protein QXF70_03380 [Candidatus Bilamarchaeaceae archaeon]